jgi:uncharacterized protein (DUF433 family)
MGVTSAAANARLTAALNYGSSLENAADEGKLAGMNWKERIVTDHAILCGKPVIKGTRVAVEFLLGPFAKGWTTGRVLESYPQLKLEDPQVLFA